MATNTVILEREEFAIKRRPGSVTAGLMDIRAEIGFTSSREWEVERIGLQAYEGVRRAGYHWLERDDLFFAPIREAIETYEAEAIAELIREELEPDPDYLRDLAIERRELGTYRTVGGRAA